MFLVILSRIVRELLLPPGCLLVVGGLGLALMGRRPRLGKGLVTASLVLFYLLSIPLVSVPLQQGLESYPPLEPAGARYTGAQAIVVLGGGIEWDHPEFGGAAASPSSLVRVRYAAWLQRLTGLPVLVSGGGGASLQDTEAYAMGLMIHRLGGGQLWMEPRSGNTWQNAANSSEVLDAMGVGTILLVTDALHMERALASFQAQGLTVIPAATGYRKWVTFDRGIMAIVPQGRILAESCHAAKHVLGRLWYALRFY